MEHLAKLNALWEDMKSHNTSFEKEDAQMVKTLIDEISHNEELLKAQKIIQERIDVIQKIVDDRNQVLDKHFDAIAAFPELNTYFVEKQRQLQEKLQELKDNFTSGNLV